jgi:hypothetical protein
MICKLLPRVCPKSGKAEPETRAISVRTAREKESIINHRISFGFTLDCSALHVVGTYPQILWITGE